LNSVYRYKDGAMEKANPAQAAGRADCGNDSADLTVEMYIISNSLRWKFGPYTEGRYYFSGNSEDAYMSGFFLPLPPEGRFPMKLSAQLNFVIRYVSPEGWQTYSPVLTVDGSELENRGSLEFRWKRP